MRETKLLQRFGWACQKCTGLLPKSLNQMTGLPHGEVRRITGWKPGDGAMQACRCVSPSGATHE